MMMGYRCRIHGYQGMVWPLFECVDVVGGRWGGWSTGRHGQTSTWCVMVDHVSWSNMIDDFMSSACTHTKHNQCTCTHTKHNHFTKCIHAHTCRVHSQPGTRHKCRSTHQ